MNEQILKLENLLRSLDDPKVIESFLKESSPEGLLISNESGAISLEDTILSLNSGTALIALDGKDGKVAIRAEVIALLAEQIKVKTERIYLSQGYINSDFLNLENSIVTPALNFNPSLQVVMGEPAPDSSQYALPLSELFEAKAFLVDSPTNKESSWQDDFIKRSQ